VLTGNSDGHTIVAIVITRRCLCNRLAEHFQERNGVGYGQLLAGVHVHVWLRRISLCRKPVAADHVGVSCVQPK